ncbi:serine hydrolase domain-containing protein [Aliifodinibius sp. S!AR15-10]|uniref:serine hydrolase domain-containing protein n=1 Tax=Aliifodinibius sp. S!AR15-10 TaxID=2950437 RepID=UPI0028707EE0|nr:serine hydrolase domain-containing protein [Aliifodinibius sp. S!AR15-10]
MVNQIESKKHRLQQLLESLTSRKPIKQAIIALESINRSFQWIGTKGKTDADDKKVNQDTPFFLASIDKMYNAAIVMKLSETGALNLNNKISTYLPDTLTKGLHNLNGVDYTERIRVRHLLSHTSGLADWLEDSPKNGKSLVDQVVEEGDREVTLEDMAALVRNRLQPHFPPQDLTAKRPKVRYSDTNYMLLIAIIEEVTGLTLAEVHRKTFIEPMNLTHTYFPGHSGPIDPTPDPMILRANGQEIQIPHLIHSIRGIYSTARDTLTFLRHLVQNDIFQNQKTFSLMQENWNRFGFPLDRAALRAPSWPIEYGLGLMRFRLPRIFSPLHPMPPVVGHTGSTGCWLFYCPQMDVLTAGSVEEVTAGAVPFRIVPKILNILRS